MSGRCLAVSNTVWIVSGLKKRDSYQFFYSNFLIPPLEARLDPSKILNFGVSGECLGVSGRCLAVSNTVWIVSGLKERDSYQFFILVS